MGLERRGNSAYYYRKQRQEGGKVVSVYQGSGPAAQAAAELDRLRRQKATAEAALRRDLAEAERQAERQADDLVEQCRALARLARLAAGYRRHKGQWRKRRYEPMKSALESLTELQERAAAEAARRKAQAQAEAERAALPPLPPEGDTSPEAIRAIFARCNRADCTQEDMTRLKQLVKAKGRELANPDGPLWRALMTEVNAMQATPTAKALLPLDIEARKAALGYDAAPAWEKPLIDHLLLCELRLSTAERSYTRLWEAGASPPLQKARFWEQKLSAAQRRYLAAVESLARLRRVRIELVRALGPDGTQVEAAAVEGPGR